MPEADIHLYRRAVAAFNSHDVETFLEFVDPQVEYHSAVTIPGGAVYHGHSGVRKYFRDFKDAWGEDFRAEAEAFFQVGEEMMMFYVIHARGRQSGAEVSMPGAQVVRWRDGRMVSARVYAERADALRDLGISAEDLRPIIP
jgi:ketosteroid isomerase-like protein